MSRTHSLYRQITYSALRGIALPGKVLDLGGSRKSGYHELFRGSPQFTVANIDESYGYDLKFDVQERFPVADASYDHVVALNLLEHLYAPMTTLAESLRVMKPGGTFVSATPFLVQVHGCPYDFYRYTDTALRRMVTEMGFAVERVEPMGKGVFAVIYQNASWLLPGPLRRLFLWKCVMMDRVLCRLSKRYKELSANYVLGYLLVAKKPA